MGLELLSLRQKRSVIIELFLKTNFKDPEPGPELAVVVAAADVSGNYTTLNN